MELSKLGDYADEDFILKTEEVRFRDGYGLAVKRGRKWITTGYPNNMYKEHPSEPQARTCKPEFTLEEWKAFLNKPENIVYNKLNLTEGFYKADLLNYKYRRKARRQMRNLRKQLAKFNDRTGEKINGKH